MPKHVLNSPQYARLSAYAVKLLFDLFAQYYGSNNGDFSACWTLMRRRGWRSKGTLHKATKELRDTGWIAVARQGGRNKASLYAITFLPVDECGGKLDIAATVAPLGWWQRDRFGTRNVCQFDTRREQVATGGG
ncbi:MAG: hypothetical protein ACREVE_15495 [Gammaproteobacteria bacterium]